MYSLKRGLKNLIKKENIVYTIFIGGVVLYDIFYKIGLQELISFMGNWWMEVLVWSSLWVMVGRYVEMKDLLPKWKN